MLRALLRVALLIALFVSIAGGTLYATELLHPAAAACQEDMPCWDCSSMGNRICGPSIPPR